MSCNNEKKKLCVEGNPEAQITKIGFKGKDGQIKWLDLPEVDHVYSESSEVKNSSVTMTIPKPSENPEYMKVYNKIMSSPQFLLNRETGEMIPLIPKESQQDEAAE